MSSIALHVRRDVASSSVPVGSLGAVKSLIEHPAIMTHASLPPEPRRALGIGRTLIRLSVGIEDVDDLLADLDQALAP